ncbi:hypothetical protein [Micromonospora rifamycinica]|uniref:DUF3995 domain-containing protein n=1 Tax=Micromonospora rifamycinica TaxID=291594 RepID=A0A109IGY9_9ACTN|nr:hypothetical protein [Micromonospora rifamycinica]KWV30356.1 hypothetical protein AWV63_23470 [Micromonospora rifamycinica]SCG64510.1 hypothetical protein GA0070623_3063 [Micromonospora rifamycinica]
MPLGVRQHPVPSTWPERAIAALGLLLLADSFLPWYRLSWMVSRYGGGQPTRHVNAATAWHSSTGWSLAVLLVVAAAVGYLACGVFTNRWPRLLAPLRWLFLLAATAGLAVAIVTWWAIPSVEVSGGYGVVAADRLAGGVTFGDIVRDRLYDRETNVTWGFYIAVFVTTALVALMLLDIVRRTGRRTAPTPG